MLGVRRGGYGVLRSKYILFIIYYFYILSKKSKVYNSWYLGIIIEEYTEWKYRVAVVSCGWG